MASAVPLAATTSIGRFRVSLAGHSSDATVRTPKGDMVNLGAVPPIVKCRLIHDPRMLRVACERTGSGLLQRVSTVRDQIVQNVSASATATTAPMTDSVGDARWTQKGARRSDGRNRRRLPPERRSRPGSGHETAAVHMQGLSRDEARAR